MLIGGTYTKLYKQEKGANCVILCNMWPLPAALFTPHKSYLVV